MFGKARTPRKLRRRSQLQRSIPALMAVLMAGVALIAARPAVKSKSEGQLIQIVSQDDMVDVPVPAHGLAKGESLRNAEFRTVRWPRSKVNGVFLHSLEPYRDYFTRSPLPENLPIPIGALSNAALDANAVAEAIPQGMRAITVKVDAESAVEGWARTGNSIDVILVRPSKENGLGMESLVIAENIKILSAGASTANSAEGENSARAPNTVTLLVTQEDALKVKTAANVGRLTFALRGNSDNNPTTVTLIDGRRLLGQSKSEARVQSFLGKATGPDGRTYILDRDSKWLRSTESVESQQNLLR